MTTKTKLLQRDRKALLEWVHDIAEDPVLVEALEKAKAHPRISK